jgi:hypothetical protein
MGVYLKKSVFYHIPKTGGTWVAKNLFDNVKGPKRNFWRHHRGVTHPHIDKKGVGHLLRGPHIPPSARDTKKFKFSFVRHPLTWYMSLWKYRTRDGALRHQWRDRDSSDFSKKCAKNDFNEFIDAVIEHFPGYYSEVVKQFESVDFMGKQENIREDLVKALTLAGEEFNEDKVRNYKGESLKIGRKVDIKYTPEQEKKILEIEKYVIDKYYS